MGKINSLIGVHSSKGTEYNKTFWAAAPEPPAKNGAKKKLVACLILCTLLGIGFITACSKAEVSVSSIDLEDTELTLALTQTKTIAYQIVPDNSTNKNVTWSSNNSDVAIVDQNGVVTPLSRGIALITVTSEDGNISAACMITVTGGPVVYMLGYADYDGYRIGFHLSVYDDEGMLNLEVGEIYFIKISDSWLNQKSFYGQNLLSLEKHSALEDAVIIYLSGNIDGEGDYVVNMTLRAGDEFFFEITPTGHMAPLYVSVLDFPIVDEDNFLTRLNEGSIEVQYDGS